MLVGASIVVAYVRVSGVLRGSSDVSKGAQLDMISTNESRGAAASGRPSTKHPWTILHGVYATRETRQLRDPENDQTSQSLIAQALPRMASKPERPRAWFSQSNQQQQM